MSLRKKDDWDEALEEADANKAKRDGEKRSPGQIIPTSVDDYAKTYNFSISDITESYPPTHPASG